MAVDERILDLVSISDEVCFATGAVEITRYGDKVVAVDGLPVYRAPTRSVAKRLRQRGFVYDTWRCRLLWGGRVGEFRVRGWH
jgi:hypothetical protein